MMFCLNQKLLRKTLAGINTANLQLYVIMATLDERFNAINADLDEATSEILAEIEKLKGETLTPEAQASLGRMEASAQALADVVQQTSQLDEAKTDQPA